MTTKTANPFIGAAAAGVNMDNEEKRSQVLRESLRPLPIARGLTLATRIESAIMSHGSELARLAREIFDQPDEVAKECAESLSRWQKQCAEHAKMSAAELGDDPKRWARLSSSATVRASQFRTIIRAKRAGLGIREIERLHNGRDFGSLGFDTLYKVAREYNETHDSEGHVKETRGRTPIMASVKLIGYLDKLEALNKNDKATLIEAKQALLAILAKHHIKIPAAEPKK